MARAYSTLLILVLGWLLKNWTISHLKAPLMRIYFAPGLAKMDRILCLVLNTVICKLYWGFCLSLHVDQNQLSGHGNYKKHRANSEANNHVDDGYNDYKLELSWCQYHVRLSLILVWSTRFWIIKCFKLPYIWHPVLIVLEETSTKIQKGVETKISILFSLVQASSPSPRFGPKRNSKMPFDHHHHTKLLRGF